MKWLYVIIRLTSYTQCMRNTVMNNLYVLVRYIKKWSLITTAHYASMVADNHRILHKYGR